MLPKKWYGGVYESVETQRRRQQYELMKKNHFASHRVEGYIGDKSIPEILQHLNEPDQPRQPRNKKKSAKRAKQEQREESFRTGTMAVISQAGIDIEEVKMKLSASFQDCFEPPVTPRATKERKSGTKSKRSQNARPFDTRKKRKERKEMTPIERKNEYLWDLFMNTGEKPVYYQDLVREEEEAAARAELKSEDEDALLVDNEASALIGKMDGLEIIPEKEENELSEVYPIMGENLDAEVASTLKERCEPAILKETKLKENDGGKQEAPSQKFPEKKEFEQELGKGLPQSEEYESDSSLDIVELGEDESMVIWFS
ncbi:hypothetical protein L596_002221 [Steinernema carpocapsae]|uniref:Uncharacterized protein n=1 Tax=Steinernema carpocapsae TaxID=34508 RepID=A0A4V6I7N3_STECR|nr:hypothetical protein L596_002221 [Steinernema carpocapsae]